MKFMIGEKSLLEEAQRPLAKVSKLGKVTFKLDNSTFNYSESIALST
jgi:hypothetical protein